MGKEENISWNITEIRTRVLCGATFREDSVEVDVGEAAKVTSKLVNCREKIRQILQNLEIKIQTESLLGMFWGSKSYSYYCSAFAARLLAFFTASGLTNVSDTTLNGYRMSSGNSTNTGPGVPLCAICSAWRRVGMISCMLKSITRHKIKVPQKEILRQWSILRQLLEKKKLTEKRNSSLYI